MEGAVEECRRRVALHGVASASSVGDVSEEKWREPVPLRPIHHGIDREHREDRESGVSFSLCDSSGMKWELDCWARVGRVRLRWHYCSCRMWGMYYIQQRVAPEDSV